MASAMYTAVPTEAQATLLSALGAMGQTDPPQDVRAELHSLLHLCRIPWVTDFIFSPEMTSLPALTAPLNMCSAVSANVNITNVEYNAVPEHPFDLHLSGTFVFVPSFAVGPVSVGFGVQECRLSCFNTWCGKPSSLTANRSHFRYVRDDENAVLFIVHRDDAFIKIELMSQTSASTRRRIFACFDYAHLLTAVRTEHGILHPDAIVNALVVLQTVSERHDCRTCDSPALGPCCCKLNLVPPSHPLDFGCLGKNMMNFVGAYQGLSQASQLHGGTRVYSANVGARIQIEGGIDDDLIARLTRWAITDQLKDKQENPLSCIMPAPAGALDDEVRRTNDGLEGQEMDLIDLALNGMEKHMEMDAELDTGCEGQDSEIAILPELGTSEVPSSFFRLSANGSSTCSSRAALLPAEELEDDEKVRCSGCADFAQSKGKSSKTVFKLANPIITRLNNGTTGASGWNSDDLWSVESRTSDRCGEHRAGSDSTVVVHRSNFGDNLSEKKVMEKGNGSGFMAVTSIAPAAGVDAMGKEYEAGMDEKERKALLRKQRNREAAQRSNMKRKQRNDSLKQALKEAHGRAAELRAKEVLLREENLRLRKLSSS